MKKKMTVLCGLLMAVVITAYSVSGTYAKYTSSMSTTDTARVAKWGINVGEKTTLDLFKASYGAGNEIASADNGDGTHDLVVAPGASGEVEIAVSGTSEVAYTLAVTGTVTNDVKYSDGVSPIKFSLDGTNWFESSALITKLSTELGANTYAANSTLNKSVTLYWAWAYNKDALDGMTGITPTAGWDAAKYDIEDTKLGTKYQGTVVTDEAAFTAVLNDPAHAAWKTYIDGQGWTTLAEVQDATGIFTAQEVRAAVQAYKDAHSSATDPKITIALNITATQAELTA